MWANSAGTACSHNTASYVEYKKRKRIWENQQLNSQHALFFFFTHDDHFSFLYYQISILTLYWTLADAGTSPGMSHPCTCLLELSSVKCPAATMNKSLHTPRVSLSCYSPREVKYRQYLGSYSDSFWKHPVQDVLEVNVISCSCWISIAGRGHIFTQSAKIPCLLPDMVKTLQVYKNAVLFWFSAVNKSVQLIAQAIGHAGHYCLGEKGQLYGYTHWKEHCWTWSSTQVQSESIQVLTLHWTNQIVSPKLLANHGSAIKRKTALHLCCQLSL